MTEEAKAKPEAKKAKTKAKQVVIHNVSRSDVNIYGQIIKAGKKKEYDPDKGKAILSSPQAKTLIAAQLIRTS